MATIQVSASLPPKLIEQLRNLGANVREECEIKVIELVQEKPIGAYTDFLLDSGKDDDPLLDPHFGHPLSQYVPVNVQAEVYQLLSTYQTLKDS
ncbi:hypothetical protein HK101_002265 [Irineochytrium annulatum]|nr:hypothetical protein HK101_002265 [Irineochytrium annulatum]